MVRVAILAAAVLLAAEPAASEQIVFQTAPGIPQGPVRDTSQQKPGTAIVRGRVFAADNGQPLRKAQVRIAAPELRENRLATTDAEGRYEFKELPAGRYTVTASKGSYVTLSYGQTRPLEPGKPLEILDKQTVEKVDLMLPRGGVITGRVVDEFGDPVSDVMVAVQRYQYMQGRRRLIPAGRGAMTNDVGEFRLFAIPPGQYYLSATLRSMMGFGAESDDRSGYSPTYFPGTPNVAEAQRVTIRVGQILSDVNMALVPTRTAKITGTAVDSQGRPMSGMMVMAVPKGEFMGMFGPPAQTRPDGSFSVGGLSPNTYTLQVMGMPGPESEYASADVTVSGDDVTGVQLVGSRPVVATGRLIVDPAAASSLRPSSVRLMAQPAVMEGPMFNPMPPSTVNDDLTFELKTRPGKMRLGLGGAPLPGWSIRAVRHHGEDVTDSGIEFRPSENLSDIEVELTNKVSDVSGLVTNGRGDAVKDYTVIAFARDRERWNIPQRYVRNARPDQDGRFKLTGLAPGDYFVVALDSVDGTEWMDPDFLDSIRTKASSFSLGDGETKTLDLKLNTTSS
jgi:protocatechuate 3,4-dioxygenase beta subunit